jgi:hypothetical protein
MPVPPPNKPLPSVKHVTSATKLVQTFPKVFERPVGTFPGTVHLEV